MLCDAAPVVVDPVLNIGGSQFARWGTWKNVWIAKFLIFVIFFRVFWQYLKLKFPWMAPLVFTDTNSIENTLFKTRLNFEKLQYSFLKNYL